MKRITLALIAMSGLLAATQAEASINLGFSSNPGSQIMFFGDGTTTTISLTPSTGTSAPNNFEIKTSDTGSMSSVGLQGNIAGPGFTYSSSDIMTAGPAQFASLGGAGNVFSLGPDGGGEQTLTADIAGVDISTFGTGGTINFSGAINLSHLMYSGTNADLLQLYNEATAPAGGAWSPSPSNSSPPRA